jgi:hypothetical protein
MSLPLQLMSRDGGAAHGFFSAESTRGLSLEREISISTHQNLIFPGAGTHFWWEAGTIQALTEEYDLSDSKFSMYGASAGSISSVLAACSVDLKNAMRVALDPPTNGLHTHADRIERWLQEILPQDCANLCSGKVNISITTITLSFLPLHRKVISVFSSKQDVIDCCLTSCHIPFFMDGHFSRTFRGDHCVDGSFLFFLHNIPWDMAEFDCKQRALMLYHCNDHEVMAHHWSSLHVLDAKSTMSMFNMGYEYGKRLLLDR